MLGAGATIARRGPSRRHRGRAGRAAAALAQPPGRLPHIVAYTAAESNRDSIVDGLRERGWVIGRNITFEWYSAEGTEALVGEHLAKTPTDVLVMGGPPRIQAAMRATTTVPIVGIDFEADPVASGFVKTLARPGGNVSGIWMDVPEIAGKQIQFLREVLPTFTRLGVLWDDRINALQLDSAVTASRALGIRVNPATLRAAAEIDNP